MHILEQYIGGAWVQLAKTDNKKDIEDLCATFNKVMSHTYVLNYFISSSEAVSASLVHGPIRLRKIKGE